MALVHTLLVAVLAPRTFAAALCRACGCWARCCCVHGYCTRSDAIVVVLATTACATAINHISFVSGVRCGAVPCVDTLGLAVCDCNSFDAVLAVVLDVVLAAAALALAALVTVPTATAVVASIAAALVTVRSLCCRCRLIDATTDAR